RKFKNLLYGDTHPYGYSSEKRFLEAIDRNVLLEYFKQEVQSKQPTIFLSGIYDEKEIKFLEEKWGRNVYPSPSSQKQTTPITNKSKDLHRVEKKQAVQSSLMLGHRSINKNHPDYANLAITNTIFGGY